MSLGSIADDNNYLMASLTAGSERKSPSSDGVSAPNKCNAPCVTTSEMGLAPSGDPVSDHRQLQAFIDKIASDGVEGLIESGHWLVHKKLMLHDGIRLRGQGMQRTIIEARQEGWEQEDYVVLHLDVGTSLHRNGIFLSDLCVIGADKKATDNGPLIRLEGMTDFLIERMQVEDASSYGIFVTGYGVGNFTNDISSTFWNSTHRGIIRQCRALRGQVGIGCEGGAENVLIMGNHCDGQALHGFRLASAYDSQIIANSATNTRNAYWIDRHRSIHVLYNSASSVERGCVYGGFDTKRDKEVSQNLWIVGNSFATSRSAITDAYHGDSEKYTQGVKIKDNVLEGGGIRLLWSKKVDLQGNQGDGNNRIRTSHHVTGMVGNNMMVLQNSSPGVVDIGHNLDSSGF